jgi:long-chain acyl-CoA synthetase
VSCFKLLPKDFEVGRELTQTLKMKRTLITELYSGEIDCLYQ